MDQHEWREAVRQLPVFDTHTHLNQPGVPIPAQNFWDIAHYFWFQQELWSVGYPVAASQLPESQRIECVADAFNAARNTTWRQIVCRMCEELYGVALVGDDNLTTESHIRNVDEAVRSRSQEQGWAESVVDSLNIRRITVNNLSDTPFPDLPEVAVSVPSWDDFQDWVAELTASGATAETREAVREAADRRVAELADLGLGGMRVPAGPFEQTGRPAVTLLDDLSGGPLTGWQAEAFVSHALFAALSDHGMFAQLFLGVERDVSPRTAMGVNDPRRIINLYPLFEQYAGGFELVIGAPQNNLDAAQAARIYPNVHLGGLWWYNFRRSTYNHAMQVRVEAVPAAKSAIVASDARCIEWCYGKILLVKWLVADFMHLQVSEGWLSEEDALWVAREWLHDAAARRYLP